MDKARSGASPIGFEDRREAPRFALIIRTAKLSCESGEYPCVVRDVSATGTRLRLFHACPPDSHLYLQLANGEGYAMERIWAEGSQAGFRFAAPIDVDRFIEEPSPWPRRPVRIKLQRPALVTAEGQDCAAELIDLSQGGARIEAGRWLAVGQQVRFEVEGLPLRFAHVRWRSGFAHGLAFHQGFRLDEFAQLAYALQPYAEHAGEPAAAQRRAARFV